MNQNVPQTRIPILIAVVTLLYVLVIQGVGIQRPFMGHYASYQGTVMASMARNMVRENFSNIFLPKTDVILQGQKSLHLNQYPFPSLLVAGAVKFVGGSYEFWGRFQAILFNLFSILLPFFIAQRLFGRAAALTSAIIFALSPLTVVYGQSFMSEPSSLFFFSSIALSMAIVMCLANIRNRSCSDRVQVTHYHGHQVWKERQVEAEDGEGKGAAYGSSSHRRGRERRKGRHGGPQ